MQKALSWTAALCMAWSSTAMSGTLSIELGAKSLTLRVYDVLMNDTLAVRKATEYGEHVTRDHGASGSLRALEDRYDRHVYPMGAE